MRVVHVLTKPKWIAGHLLALIAIVTFANLGLWQLRRHDERAARNAAIAQGLEQPATPFDQLAAGERDYRRTTVRGRYDPGGEFLLTPRTERGPGHHLVTPFRLPDGRVLLVDRGWIPFPLDTPPFHETELAPPKGELDVRGVLLPATESDPGAVRGDDGRLLRVRAIDPAALAGQEAVADVSLLLEDPSPGELPVPGPVPEPDAGPHLSYAVQWFVFAAVVAGGYPLLLRRALRDARDDAGDGVSAAGSAPTTDR